MSGSCEYGRCEVCGDAGTLVRTYFHYGVKCECHSPDHFEMVRHHSHCEPKEPRETKITFRTEDFKSGKITITQN